jgi:hypothetical protein
MTNPAQLFPSILRSDLRRTAIPLLLAAAWVVIAIHPAQARTFILLYSFTGAADGASPFGDLIMDANGNLYGTTYVGGSKWTRYGLHAGSYGQ